MGTRGIVGFRENGNDHLVYNHFDSYPDCLGQIMVDFARTKAAKNPTLYKEMASAMRDISGTTPTEIDIQRCKDFTDLGVSNQSTDDWYCLLRDTQGDPEAILKCGLYEAYDDFIKDSLFCEYAYVINFDTGMLEFYEGFQNEPHDSGRYATSEPNGSEYYPCRLVGEFPFDDIPDDWMRQCYPSEAEDE